MKRFRYSSDAFTTDRALGYLLRRTYKLVQERMGKVFDDRSLTLSQWIALTLVGEQVARTSSEVARQLGHNTGATTRLVDHLESRGFLERCREKADRRVVTLSLTASGRDAVAALTPMVIDTWNTLLEGFDHDEIETLIRLLTRLVERLDEDSTRASSAPMSLAPSW
jgi:DNA-binding MarR family transcriptional regulator